MDEQDLEELQETLQEDYEIGCAMLLPLPVRKAALQRPSMAAGAAMAPQ